jgi:cell division protein FtsB
MGEMDSKQAGFRKHIAGVNKYHVTLSVFAAMILFFGDSTLLDRYRYNRQISKLQSEIHFYRQQIEENKAKLNVLKTDNESLERYAREQFLMTGPNEELYIVTH